MNKKINVRSEYQHTVRAMVHHLLTNGSFEIDAPSEKAGAVVTEKREGTKNQLHGMLGFIDSIDLYNKRNTAESKDSDRLSSKGSMYRRFVIYTDFYAAQRPVIICEGKTDNVYLTHAIRSLAKNFSELAEIGADGKIRLKVRLYKYYKSRRSSTARILGLNEGGSSVLAKFIQSYKKETSRIKAPGQNNPVMILYDNDSGAPPIRSGVKEASGTTVTGTEPFIQVIRNLYAVPTPPVNGTIESKIEDLFDATTRGVVIDGKKFNPENKNFDPAIHYGKSVFAYRVIEKHAKSINFDGFHPLLSRLVAVIKLHSV